MIRYNIPQRFTSHNINFQPVMICNKTILSKKMFQIINEMMTDRGYVLKETSAISHIYSKDDSEIHILSKVFQKIVVQNFKKILLDLKTLNAKHAIVIYIETITPSVREYFKNKSDDLYIETFAQDEFLFNISRHYLQPKFTLLSESETANVYKKWGKTGFPKIKSEDPIVRYYNWKEGSLIKCSRENSVMYRVVC